MPRIRVLIVDDAVVMRKLITDTLARDADIEIVGTAANGRIGLQRIIQVNPDIITLDVEMPEMNGLEMLRELRKTHPKLPVIMFSTLTMKGASATLDAITLGATDYVTKPANVGSVSESIAMLERELIPRIKAYTGRARPARAVAAAPGIAFRSVPPRAGVTARAKAGPIEILTIGSSTGGPNALADVFAGITADFPAPIVLVQHMPPIFTALLAERLGKRCPLRFFEATHGQSVERGCVYIAPGGRHMEIRREQGRASLVLHDGPPENSCRPAVDVLFRSVAQTYGPNALAVVLTGMGQDGANGCAHVKERGGRVLVQDEPTSVVWGMPGSVAGAGLADQILPLQNIASEINRIVRSSTQATAA
jgi:two-component system, chemotaxis family, protein-glutamate methylesterase/glutaminase